MHISKNMCSVHHYSLFILLPTSNEHEVQAIKCNLQTKVVNQRGQVEDLTLPIGFAKATYLSH